MNAATHSPVSGNAGCCPGRCVFAEGKERSEAKKTRVRMIIIITLRFPEGRGFSPMGLWAEKKKAKITFTRDHHE